MSGGLQFALLSSWWAPGLAPTCPIASGSVFVGQVMCETGPGYTVQSMTLYEATKDWALRNGHKPISSTVIAQEWKRLGFERYESGGCRKWRGLRLRNS